MALETAPSRPRLWKRYVDDNFCILRKDTAEELLNHLDGIQPTIKFTVELEDGTLPFLDTLARRREHRGLDITVYRKPHTHRQVPPLPIPPPSPCEKRSGEVFPQQGQRDHQLTEQPSEGSGPPGQSPQAEWLSYQLYLQSFCPTPPPPQVLDTSSPDRDHEKESRPPVMMIPYDVGMSENIRQVKFAGRFTSE